MKESLCRIDETDRMCAEFGGFDGKHLSYFAIVDQEGIGRVPPVAGEQARQESVCNAFVGSAKVSAVRPSFRPSATQS